MKPASLRSAATNSESSSLATWLRDVLWSDWGRPKRIVLMLDRIGKRPAFADADLSALHA